MDFGIYAGDTDKTIYLRLRDSTTGLAKTGLAFNSAGAVCSYTLPLAARAAITLATQTVTGAHSDGGFVEVDATNCKGLYRLDLPDAAIASGDYTVISIEFDGTIEESIEIPLHTRKVNVTQLNGGAQSLLDLKDFADDGYDPSTNKVQGVVLVDTVSTLTNLPAITADWITATGLAASAVTEIQSAITGISGPLDTDVNGAIRIVDGTGARELDTLSGTVLLRAATQASIDAIEADTNELQTDDVPGLIAALNDLSTADIDARLVAIGLDHLISASVTGTDVADNSIIAKIVSKSATADWDSFVNTTDSLEALADSGGGGPTAADIADAVWEEAIADHSGTSGSTAEALNAAGSAGDPWVTALPGAYGAGSAGFILGTNLNTTISSRSSQTTQDTIDGIVDSILAIVGTTGAVVNDFTATGLTELRTYLHGADVAADMDANGAIRIVDGTGARELDTLSGTVALRSATQASIDAIETDSNELQTDWANGGRLDSILDSTRANTEGEWIWLDPNAAGGGDGSPGLPYNTFADAYAAGQRIKFAPSDGEGGSGYTMPTITLSNGLILDINGWRTSGWNNVTFANFERIFSSAPGGRIIGTGTITLGLAAEISNVTIDCTTLTFKYGYFKDVFFNCNITFVTHAFSVKSDFYYCWWDGNDFDTSNAHTSHTFNLLGCYGDMTLSGLKSSQVFIHYGWCDLTILSATGGTINHTSHVEIDNGVGGTFTDNLVSEAGSVSGFTTAAKAEIQQEAEDALAAYGASTHSAADVWSAGTRTLTALGFTLDSADTDSTLIEEIRDAITGGAWALNTDSGGNVKISDGTGANQLSLTSGLIDGITGIINTLDALDTAQDTQHTTTQNAIAALNDIAAADVLTQIETALNTTTRSMPGQATPSSTPTLVQAILQRFQLDTNPADQDATTQQIYNRAGSVVQQKRTVSESGGTVSLGALVTGP